MSPAYQNRPYFLLFMIFLCIGSYLVFTVPKGGIVKSVNEETHLLFDYLFRSVNLLGTGIPTLLLVIGLLFYRYGHALLLFVSAGLASIFTQICKNFLFDDVKRPKHYFPEDVFASFDKVAGISINAYHSFPSGHTTMAFATFCALSLLIADKRWGVLFFFLALLTGISRVYLLQHFFIDIYGGAIVGTFVSLMVFAILLSTNYWQKGNWPHRSLKLFKRS